MTKKILNGQHRLHAVVRYTVGYCIAGYCIMDQRANYDVDKAIILQVCDEGSTLAQATQERDRDWPGQCLVDMQTWEVVDLND